MMQSDHIEGPPPSSHHDDEIDLRELFLALWDGRRLILAFMGIFLVLASIFLWKAERKYTVTSIFMPVASQDSGPNLSGLGGLASLAGVSLPSGDSGDVTTFKTLLRSEEVADILLSNTALTSAIFAAEWDEDTARFVAPTRSAKSYLAGALKYVLTGQSRGDYIPPNAPRLSSWLEEAFSVAEDRDTGFLTLTSETPNPDLILAVMEETTRVTDAIIKDRFVAGAEQTVEFYQRKIATARSREHREALAQLITQEEQKLMLASNSNYFVVEPLTHPTVSLYPTSPKSSLVLALALVMGSFVGAAVVLLRKALNNAH